jgi:type IV pilus assembly protein PilV
VNAARKGQQGATMVEVLVAALLFSIGVIGLLRVLGSAVTDTGAVQYRATAAVLADSALGQMWVGASSDSLSVPVPELPGGQRTVTVDDNRVTVKITWQAPSASAESSYEVVGTITK